MSAMLDTITRIILKYCSTDGRCTLSLLLEAIQSLKDSPQVVSMGPFDASQWIQHLIVYSNEPYVDICTQSSEESSKEVFITLCEAQLQNMHHVKATPLFDLSEKTKDFVLKLEKEFVSQYLLFGGKNQEHLTVAHAVWKYGAEGAMSPQLALDTNMPLTKLLYVIQNHLGAKGVVVSRNTHRGHNQLYAHVRCFYAPGMDAILSRCINVRINEDGSENDVDPIQDLVDAAGTRNIPPRQAHGAERASLRFGEGGRAWNHTYFRATHVTHSEPYHRLRLHARFPNTAIATKADRFYAAINKSTVSYEPYTTDLLNLPSGKYNLYKTSCLAHAFCSSGEEGDRFCHMLTNGLQETESFEETPLPPAQCVDVVDIDMDSLPASTCARIIAPLQQTDLENFPSSFKDEAKWLRGNALACADSSAPAEFMPSGEYSQATECIERKRFRKPYDQDKVMNASFSEQEVSVGNGYKKQFFDRVQLLHEHITEIMYRTRADDDTLKKLFCTIDDPKRDVVYRQFKEIYVSQNNPSCAIEQLISVKEIFESMPLSLFCKLFRGKWNFRDAQQGLNMQPPEADSESTEMSQFFLPKNMSEVTIAQVPTLQGTTFDNATIYAQLFILFEGLDNLHLINISLWPRDYRNEDCMVGFRYPPVFSRIDEMHTKEWIIKDSLVALWHCLDNSLYRMHLIVREEQRINLDAYKYMRSASPASNKRIKHFVDAFFAAGAHRPPAVPWWFSLENQQIIKCDPIATPEFRRVLIALLPSIEKLLRTLPNANFSDIAAFFQVEAEPVEDTEVAMQSMTQPSPLISPRRCFLTKQFSECFVLFITFAVTPRHGRRDRAFLTEVYQMAYHKLLKSMASLLLTRKHLLNTSYLQSVYHAAIKFAIEKDAPAEASHRFIIDALIHAVIELFCGTEIRSSETCDDVVPLAHISDSLEPGLLKDFLAQQQHRFTVHALDEKISVDPVFIDWKGIPPTWTTQKRNDSADYANTKNLRWYADTYVALAQGKAPESAPAEEVEVDNETPRLVNFAKELMNKQHGYATNTKNPEVKDAVDALMWTTDALRGRKRLAIAKKEGESINHAYRDMAMECGYAHVLKSKNPMPLLETEDAKDIYPKIVAEAPNIEIPFSAPLEDANIAREYQKNLWDTLHSQKLSNEVEKEDVPMDTAVSARHLQQSADGKIDDIKADIVAYLLLNPGSEEMTIYQNTTLSSYVSLSVFARALEALVSDSVIEVDCYRARSSRGRRSAVPAMWLRAYSLIV